MPDDLLLLRIEAVCRRTSLSRSHVYVLIQSGRLPSVRVNGSRRVTASALEAFVRQLEDEAKEIAQ